MKLSILLIMSFIFSTQSKSYDYSTKAIDLKRYLGKWYEIARFDHSFERNMERVTAEYSLKPDGKIRVINKGYRNGNQKVAEAKAMTTENPGVLRVSFFLNFYSDYRILEIDEDYQWALVGGASPNYLWILSRTPELGAEDIDLILRKAERRGFDVRKLIWVEQ